ncbi:MAG: RNA polymerase sigma factor [Armatimonadota bacterium]
MSADRSDCPDEVLVEAARGGDRTAFDALAARYRAGLLPVTLDLSRSLGAAEDLTQEPLAGAWGTSACCATRRPSARGCGASHGGDAPLGRDTGSVARGVRQLGGRRAVG